MTVFPVVATPLNVRTEHVCGQRLCQLSYCKTLVADPAFVVLPEVPDLACDFCAGEGTWITHSDDIDHGDEHVELTCESCGGSGVSPVYAATWQHRHIVGVSRTTFDGYEWGIWHRCNKAKPEPRAERRQLVEWRATDVTVLPVVDKVGAWAYPCIQIRDGRAWRWTSDQTDTAIDVTDEPWAVDLRPGQFVLRLSGWEHLQQPHTYMRNPDACDECASERGCCDGRKCNACEVPLSVPDGVLSWIELA